MAEKIDEMNISMEEVDKVIELAQKIPILKNTVNILKHSRIYFDKYPERIKIWNTIKKMIIQKYQNQNTKKSAKKEMIK